MNMPFMGYHAVPLLFSRNIHFPNDLVWEELAFNISEAQFALPLKELRHRSEQWQVKQVSAWKEVHNHTSSTRFPVREFDPTDIRISPGYRMNLTREMEQQTPSIVLTMKAQLEYNAICAELERHLRPQLYPMALEVLAEAYKSYGDAIIRSIKWEEVHRLTSESEIGNWHDIELNKRFGCMSLETLFPITEGKQAHREFRAVINTTKWQFPQEIPKQFGFQTPVATYNTLKMLPSSRAALGAQHATSSPPPPPGLDASTSSTRSFNTTTRNDTPQIVHIHTQNQRVKTPRQLEYAMYKEGGRDLMNWLTEVDSYYASNPPDPLPFSNFMGGQMKLIILTVISDFISDRHTRNTAHTFPESTQWESWPWSVFKEVLTPTQLRTNNTDPTIDFKTNMHKLLQDISMKSLQDNPFLDWALAVTDLVQKTNYTPAEEPKLAKSLIDELLAWSDPLQTRQAPRRRTSDKFLVAVRENLREKILTTTKAESQFEHFTLYPSIQHVLNEVMSQVRYFRTAIRESVRIGLTDPDGTDESIQASKRPRGDNQRPPDGDDRGSGGGGPSKQNRRDPDEDRYPRNNPHSQQQRSQPRNNPSNSSSSSYTNRRSIDTPSHPQDNHHGGLDPPPKTSEFQNTTYRGLSHSSSTQHPSRRPQEEYQRHDTDHYQPRPALATDDPPPERTDGDATQHVPLDTRVHKTTATVKGHKDHHRKIESDEDSVKYPECWVCGAHHHLHPKTSCFYWDTPTRTMTRCVYGRTPQKGNPTSS